MTNNSEIEDNPQVVYATLEEGNVNVNQQRITKCYNYAISVRFFCFLEILVNFLSMICYSQVSYLPLVLISYLGWRGARKFSKCNTVTYLYWTTINFILKCVFLSLYYKKEKNKLQEDNTLGITICLTFLMLMINIWILKIIYEFYKTLKDLNNDEIIFMKNLSSGRVYRILYW